MRSKRHEHDETQWTISSDWRAVLGSLQVEMANGGDYETFVAVANGVREGEDGVVIEVPNEFHRQWISEHLMGKMCRTVESVYGRGTKVTLRTVIANIADSLEGTGMDGDHRSWSDADRNKHRRLLARESAQRYPLHFGREMSLDNFLTSSSNRVAHEACAKLIESPRESDNPIFIVAETGLGKSHLCNAITRGLRANGMNVIFLAARRFVEEYVEATRESSVADLAYRYREADAFVIDGIEKLIAKTGTQSFLLDLLDHLLSAGSKVVATANAGHPLNELSPEILSRLSGGLEVRIGEPDTDLKTRAITHFARDRKLDLMPDALEYLVKRAGADMRVLLGGVARVAASIHLTPSGDAGGAVQVSRAMAEAAARDRVVAPAPKLATPDEILQAVGTVFGLQADALKRGGRGGQAVSTARDLAVFLMREESGMTLAETGAVLGGRGHSTIVEAMKRYEVRRESDASLMQSEVAARQTLRSAKRSG